MKDYLSQQYYMNTLSQWLIALVYIIGGVIIAKVAYYLFKKISKSFIFKTETKLDDILIETLEKPVIFAITIFGFYLGMEQLNMTSKMELLVSNTDKVLIAICVTWFVARMVNAFLGIMVFAKCRGIGWNGLKFKIVILLLRLIHNEYSYLHQLE